MGSLALSHSQNGLGADNASKPLKASLTAALPGVHVYADFRVGLDGWAMLPAFSRAMNGLNHICGISREIIR